jgi:hypothetical protein
MLRLLIAPVLAIGLLPGTATASVEDTKAARVMWTAFECGKYAQLAGKEDRSVSLYESGVEAGRRFYGALEAGTITEEELAEHAPFVLNSLAAGPSIDFIVGRVFQYAVVAASDDVSKEDQNGLPLPMGEWLMEPDKIAAKAGLLYTAGNCDLL